MKLTRQDIRIVLFLLAVLVMGAVVKHYRHRVPASPAVSAARP